MTSPSIRCRTAAEVEPRGRRGSLSEDESEEELGRRFTLRAGTFFGATVPRAEGAATVSRAKGATGVLGAALPLGLPRGRFTGTSCAGVSLFGFSAGASSALVDASSAFVFQARLSVRDLPPFISMNFSFMRLARV